MISIENFDQVTAQIESERGIPKAVLISAIEQALISACRKRLKLEEHELEATLDIESGLATVFLVLEVVDEVEHDEFEISLADAKRIDPKAKIGDKVKKDITPEHFGRIAAQTAKQVIIQRIREAEKSSIYDEFQGRIGQLITGTVQSIEPRHYLINLGRTEALLTQRDQIRGERFSRNEKIKLYISDIEKTPKGPMIRISRTHPGLLQRLLELEVPEIQDGIIEIKSIAREPGVRAKVAVKTNNPAVGAVGTVVGHMGARVQSIIKELGNERIDVLEWDDDPRQFIANSLKPAKISQVIITNDEKKEAVVVVPNDQLSLAIGKVGVNVRLSARLTDWNIDILSEDNYAKKADEIRQSTHISIVDRIKQDKTVSGSGETGSDNSFLSKMSAAFPSQEQASPTVSPDDFELTEEDNAAFAEGLTDSVVKAGDLADQLGLSISELKEKAKEYDIDIKTVRSNVQPSDVNLLRKNLG